MKLTMTTRPSRLIYTRQDKAQAWRQVDSAYELGYVAAEADIAAGFPPLTWDETRALWGVSTDYAEGYGDAFADHATFTQGRK